MSTKRDARDPNDELRRYLERYTRKVKFSAEEMAEILDDVAWMLVHRYRETASVPMEDWGARIAAELMICEDRKATKVHGQPDTLAWLDSQVPTKAGAGE